jgi:hypothetical protein
MMIPIMKQLTREATCNVRPILGIPRERGAPWSTWKYPSFRIGCRFETETETENKQRVRAGHSRSRRVQRAQL